MSGITQTSGPPPALDASEFAAISDLIQRSAGIVIAPGKASMVQSRLAKRLRARGLRDYASYIDLIRSPSGSDELREMISALTTNVTQFFRESHHFNFLKDTALLPLIAKAKRGGRLRIWSAGCSSGQEAYSIAMVLAELEPEFAKLDIRILATDIDASVIHEARAGLYDRAAIEGIPAPYQHKYLMPEGTNFRICEPLRRLVSYRELNLHETWPMKGRFEIIFCRNVVIYFAAEAQNRLWHRFEESLTEGGWLFVGHSERVPQRPDSRLHTAGITTYRLRASRPEGSQPWH
ncbi:CheR family methyltransferase [Pseudothioclava arenosa]|uniref:Chemotaxis protein methyltransferase n=1 Tax=Pseudothioclava arenosa TaxID=1795308 RepID=A0A2A4CS48_9RHOB|nr:protein-glutamate O-methyltransferase [Pseudothioclava arenosa]PCD76924.1 chemotaxis protein [Pseudothioclava arenosa]